MPLRSLTKKKNILNILFQAASEGILIVDSSQTIIVANKAAEEMFGYDKGELENCPLDNLIPMGHRGDHSQHFKKFMKNSQKRQMGRGRELFGKRKDGSEFPVEAGLNPFEIEGEQYVMSLVIDISVRRETHRQIEELNNKLEEKIKIRTRELSASVDELKNLNVELEDEIQKRKQAEQKIKIALEKEKELNELKTKFLSLVSHEFKTPLSGILTSATLIEKYPKEEQQEKREKHLNTIKNKVRYLNNILSDFLSIERLKTGAGQYKYTNFSLKSLINEVVYNANITLKKGQEIHYPQDLEDQLVCQDEKIVELILSNLLGNSIKYSPEDTAIEFRVQANRDRVIFKIEDNGMGIPENDQKHIFDRYFRAENALLNQGTGIGLNIAKSHMENLKGSISFESVENEGTCFTVELPNLMSEQS